MANYIKIDSPDEVFTPNTNIEKNSIYIRRKETEEKLLKNLNLNINLLIQGDHGTGKSWLVRNILKENNYYHRFIDLKEVKDNDNLLEYLQKKLIHYKWRYDNNSDKLNSSEFYHEEFLKFMKNKSRLKYRHANIDLNKNSYIILEHFEEIIGNKSLLDDIYYFISLTNSSNHSNIHVIILSSLSNTSSYLYNFENLNFHKLPDLNNFTFKDSYTLIDLGFNKLNLSFSKPKLKSKYYYNIASRAFNNPLELQKLCLLIATKAFENNKIITGSIINDCLNDKFIIEKSSINNNQKISI